jgi:predicted acetyltransferase
MEPIYRPIMPEEYDEALDHWHNVFGEPRAYFELYYRADPMNQPGDTFGCWVDGKIVSAVHVCRRPMELDGRTLLCGGIANVATHPDYRKGGLSGGLLKMAIAHMEQEGFAYSCLGTGVHGHYARYGWEQVDMPRYKVTPTSAGRPTNLPPSPAIPTPEVQAIYAADARPLSLNRAERYFEKWVTWFWGGQGTELQVLPDAAYVVVQYPTDHEDEANIVEWRALDAASEKEILAEAVASAVSRGRTRIGVAGHPRFGGLPLLEELGVVEATPDTWHMFRKFNLSDEDYAEVKRLYASGEANWWPGDGF